MNAMSATALRRNLYNAISMVNEECEPLTITNSKGKGAVLVGEDEWRSIKETLYLEGVSGLAEDIREGMATPVEDCAGLQDLEW